HVPSHGPRRDANPKLDEELGGDPFLATGPIRRRHRRDQLLQVHRNRRPPGPPRFPAPPQPENLSMPPDERLRLDTVSRCRHSTKNDKVTSVMRVGHRPGGASSDVPGTTPTAFAGTGFSAASWARDRITDDTS